MPESMVPNEALTRWIRSVVDDLTHKEAHAVNRAALVIECSECGTLHIRGFNHGADSDPCPLLDKLEIVRATGRTVQ